MALGRWFVDTYRQIYYTAGKLRGPHTLSSFSSSQNYINARYVYKQNICTCVYIDIQFMFMWVHVVNRQNWWNIWTPGILTLHGNVFSKLLLCPIRYHIIQNLQRVRFTIGATFFFNWAQTIHSVRQQNGWQTMQVSRFKTKHRNILFLLRCEKCVQIHHYFIQINCNHIWLAQPLCLIEL